MLLLGEMIPGKALWAELELQEKLTGITFPSCEVALGCVWLNSAPGEGWEEEF